LGSGIPTDGSILGAVFLIGAAAVFDDLALIFAFLGGADFFAGFAFGAFFAGIDAPYRKLDIPRHFSKRGI
jgi:hypothetical protein